MSERKIVTIIIASFLFFAPMQKAEAVLISKSVEWSAQFASQIAYYTTKYSLKAGFWVVKKTAKGLWWCTKKGYKAITDSNKKSAPKQLTPEEYMHDDHKLPPVPEIQELPEITY